MTDSFASTSKLATPILPAIAYPTHCLYVPLELWAINLTASSGLGLVVGTIRGIGIDTIVIIVVAIALHVWFMLLYQRDPFVVTVILAKRFHARPFAPRPFLSSLPTRNLIWRPSNLIRLS